RLPGRKPSHRPAILGTQRRDRLLGRIAVGLPCQGAGDADATRDEETNERARSALAERRVGGQQRIISKSRIAQPPAQRWTIDDKQIVRMLVSSGTHHGNHWRAFISLTPGDPGVWAGGHGRVTGTRPQASSRAAISRQI